jgi:hypothetical protein
MPQHWVEIRTNVYASVIKEAANQGGLFCSDDLNGC